MAGLFSNTLKNTKAWFTEFRLAINVRAGGGQRIPTFRESIPNLMPLALLAWLFAGSEICQRAMIELNGTVLSSETSCAKPYNNRCSTTYLVVDKHGLRSTYVAGPTDESLERRLPTGTLIDKKKWSLAYSVNGRHIDDFPIGFYGTLIALGALCAWSGVRPAKRPA
jgi:hypothetical protein